ncbi:MAG: Zn-ribbon domain-containing OB-fold protein [Acidimicrobiales bacterium]
MTTRYDLPIPDDYTRTWWDAAAEGRLLVVRCHSCHQAHYYPRPFCPRCGGPDVSWEQVSGRATLYTWSVVHQNDLPPFRDRVPYVAAIVDLDEGPRMMTIVVGAGPDELQAGMTLQVDFEALNEDFTIPVFRPAP